MKKTNAIRITAALLTLIMTAMLFTACGAADVSVSIKDSGSVTQIEAKAGTKISDVLSEANIKLGEKDETSPAADTELTEKVTEIIVKRYAKVSIVKDGETKEVELVGGTVEEALKQSGLTLADNDIVDAELTAYLKDGMTITVTKELTVSLTADGKTEESATKSATVEAFLKEKNVTVGKDDIVSEKLDAKLTDGMKIVVKRVEYKEEKVTEKINYSIQQEYSSSMASGTSQVTQEGEEGEKEITYKVKYVDGKEDSRETVSEKVTKEAVDEIITYGTAGSGNSGNSGNSGDSGSSGGRTVVSKVPYYDCDGSGHGYFEITYSDGSVEYEEF